MPKQATLRIICLMACFATLACARVVTWTAYSEDSQDAADELAIGGVARQISSHVKASTALYQSETVNKSGADLQSQVTIRNSVHSDIFLKGIRLQKLPKKDNKFGTTATLDLDELTSNYRFKLQTIQQEVSSLESRAKAALAEHRYVDAYKLLGEIPGVSRPYESILEEMATYVTLDNSLRLKTEAATIKDSLVKGLRKLEFKVVPGQGFTGPLQKDSSYTINVKVSDSNGGVAAFPITVEHGGKILEEASTNSAGEATFKIPAKQLAQKPHELLVVPSIPLDLRTAASLNPVKVPYQIDLPNYRVNLDCGNRGTVCTALLERLSKLKGNVTQSSDAKPATVRIEAQPTRKLKDLTSYSIVLSLTKDGKSCQVKASGTGRTEEEAVSMAVGKMDLLRCVETLDLLSF